MKKLLCLVFVLIALLGLTLAVSAAVQPEKINISGKGSSGESVTKILNPDGTPAETRGGAPIGNIYDNSVSSGVIIHPNGGPTGSYVTVDLNDIYAGGYFVTAIDVVVQNKSTYSMYYTYDGKTWNEICTSVTGNSTDAVSYTINDYATQVKYVFHNYPGWIPSLSDLSIYGVKWDKVECRHTNIESAEWAIVTSTQTCTAKGTMERFCPDCGERFTKQEAPELGHDIVTTVTKPGTSISYGEATATCKRCDFTIDFRGEVELTSSAYAGYYSLIPFVNITPSSVGHASWGQKATYLTDDITDVTGWGQWYADTENDENEYVMLTFHGALDLTKLDIWVPNDNNATLRISVLDEATDAFVVIKELPTYEENKGMWESIKLSIPLLGTSTSSIKLQVISSSDMGPGFVYKKMLINEIDLYGIALGCGLDADNHECVYDEFVEFGVAPTCQTVGTAIYKCACNSTKTVEVAASDEYHPYKEVEGTRVNSTCTVAGSYTGMCELCNAETTITLDFDTENGHEFEETSREDADCVNAGKIVYTCANCKATKEEEIKATGHNYQETSKTEPDCVTAGEKVSTCANCGDVKTEEIAVKGHTWVLNEDEIETEPTCGDEGFGAYYCSVCSATKEDVIPATGNHTWNEEPDKILVAPTCEGTGSAQFSCSECEATNNGHIAALGHNLTVEVEGSREEATCTTDGKYEVTCANGCGKSQTKTIAALDHDWADATCLAPKTCKRENCGATEGDPSTEHTWTAASCTAPRTCSVCSETDGEALGHTYGWKIPVKNEEGEIVKYIHGCSVCLLEAKEDTDAEGKGLGYSTTLGDGLKIYYVSTWSDFKNKVNLSDAAVVRFIDNAEADYNNPAEVKNGNVIIDLGGYSVTSGAKSATFHLNYAKGLVNGTLYEGGYKQAVSVRTAEFIKDFVIEVLPTATDCSGIIIFPGQNNRKTYLGSMENVTIKAQNNGIETWQTLTGIDPVIGTIDGVTVTTQGQALTLYSNVGLIKNSTFAGKNFAVIFKYLNGTVEFQNCTLSGDNACLYVNDIVNNAKLVVDSATTFATKGLLFYASEEHKAAVDFGMLETAKAAVNGRLYATFAEAFEAFEASDKDVTDFALMADLELSSSIKIEKNVNFSLGGGKYEFVYEGTKKQETKPGYTVSIPNDTKGNGVFLVMPTGTLTISGNGVVNAAGNSANGFNIAIWVYGGQATIEGGTYTNEDVVGNDAQYDLIYVNNGGKLLVTGGTFKCKTPQWTLNMGDNSNSEIVVKDGIFYGYDPSKSNTEPNGPVSFVSEEVICVYENADGAYVLASKHLHDHTSQQTNTGCAHTDVAATCTESAYRTHTCPCGDVRIETTGEPTGHKWLDATCLAPKTCSREGCGATEGEALPHNYVPAENEDGSTTYTCSNGCNDSYVINNALVNGTYCMLGMPANSVLVFENGALTVDGEEGFTYTYNVTTGMIDTTLGTFFQVIDGKIYHRGSQELKAHSYVADVTAPTCTDKGYTTYTCPACNDTYKDNETAALGHTEAIDQAVAPTCTTTGLTEGKHCSVCNVTLVAQDTVDALGHTEVEIAPIPSYKDVNKKVVAGMSSGVECSVCGTVITQPVVVNKFYVQGNRLSLSDYVNVDYGLVVPDNYTNVYVVYVSDANVDSDSVVVQYDGSGISTYRGIRMQNLGDNIHATMYATTPEGLTAVFVQAEYSVRTYCVNQLAKDSNGAEFKTMISDLIEAGAIAQQIKKYKLDQLVNKGADIEGLLTPSTNTTISGEKIDTSVVYNSELNQKANITNKNLSVGNAMAVQFLLTIKSDVLANVRLEVVVDRSAQKLSNLTYTYSMAEENIEVYNASKSQYIVKVPDLRVIEYDAPIIATIYVGDEAVQQQTYSVNTYFENNYAKTSVDATMRKFLLAMYNYGMSAAAYKNA